MIKTHGLSHKIPTVTRLKSGLSERPLFGAVFRARWPILTLALTYLLSFVIGVVMVHRGTGFALSRRDQLVIHGERHDPASLAFQQGHTFQAIAIEFGRECYRTVLKTALGLTVVLPYPSAVRGGWYGGILSVDSNHASQLRDPAGALYYLGFELLQIASASLAGGAGINLTLASICRRHGYDVDKWLRVPKTAVQDLLRIYLLVFPLLLGGAIWKYFVP
jgi:hypothetical protein